MTDRALKLLRRGWSVIPVHIPVNGGQCTCGNEMCSWPGKHPRVRWREFTERRPSEEEVREWFDDEFYGSNLGVVTGRVSNLVVIDVDGSLNLFKRLELPKTLTSRTGGGGYHFFYDLAGSSASSGIGVTPGIDVKADGGFVVLPPSIHLSGRNYRWTRRMKPTVISPSELPKRVSTQSHNGEWVSDILTGVSEGDRSISAARLAGRYAQLGLSIDETVMLLVTWNSQNIPPMPWRELGATISSVYKRHKLRSEANVTTLDDMFRIFGELTGREV